MKKDFSLWRFAGFALVSLGGTLLHFLYDWTGKSILAAPFSGVNESTWEHMKLLYFPLLLFALVQRRFFSAFDSFWCVKLLGTLLGLILIPVLFYTYNGAFGRSPDWLNITFFFISTAAVFLVETYLFRQNALRCRFSKLAPGLLCLIGLLFVIFTFLPPKLPLFRDPVTGTYGLQSPFSGV